MKPQPPSTKPGPNSISAQLKPFLKPFTEDALEETSINLISEHTRLEGKLTFGDTTRIHGVIQGEVHAKQGSRLILGSTGMIEGNVFADSIWIDGCVRGDVRAESRVVISGSGRVIGNIFTPALRIEVGGFFEGLSQMPETKEKIS